MIPPPNDEVVREGKEGDDEHIQEKEVPPQPNPKMNNQVLTYLRGLSDQGQTPLKLSAQTPPVKEYNIKLFWLPS